MKMKMPSNQQRVQIEKYFYLLVQEFIKDRQNINIKIVFASHLGTSDQGDTLGNTHWEKKPGRVTWQIINGVKVPGSEKIIYPDKHNFIISFLNYYSDKERWRGTVVHEFTHLYLFFTVGNHTHDDRFYSYMEYFENWLDKNQGLTPRQDKSGDRSQYVGGNNNKEKICPECSRSTRYHSPQCSYNPNNPQKIAEFNRLRELLSQSSDLTTLEKNWEIVKNNPLYSENKLKSIKKKLDDLYQTQKQLFYNYSLNNSDLNGNNLDIIIWLGLALGVIIILILLVYLVGSKQNVKQRQPKKR